MTRRLSAVLVLTLAATAAPGQLPDDLVALNPVGHPGGAHSVLLTPDGKTVLTFGRGGAVRGWDADTGKPRFVFWQPPGSLNHTDSPFGPRVSPDGKLLALPYRQAGGAGPGQVCLIPLDDRRTYRVIGGQTFTPADAAFSPDGKRLATMARRGVDIKDAQIRVWDVATGKQVREILIEPDHAPTRIRFTPDGKLTAAVALVNTGPPPRPGLRTWDVDTGNLIAEIRWPAGSSPDFVRWSPDGRTFLTNVMDGLPYTWRAAHGTPRLNIGQPAAAPLAVVFDARSLPVAIWDAKTAIVVRNEVTQQEHGRFPPVPDDINLRAVLTPDARRGLITGHHGRQVVVFDVATGKEVSRFRVGFPEPAAVGWSADGTRLAWGTKRELTGSRQRADGELTHSLRLTDLSAVPVAKGEGFTQALRERAGVKLSVSDYTASVTAGGKTVPLAYESEFDWETIADGTLLPKGGAVLGTALGLREYDTTTGKLVREYGARETLGPLAPSPDGTFFAGVSGYDPLIRVYRVGRIEPALTVFPAGDEWVAWTPDGSWAGNGDLAGRLTRPEPGKLQTFVSLSAEKDKHRPDKVKAALEP